MKEVEFNLENSVKVIKAMERCLVQERVRDVLFAKITGEPADLLLEGVQKAVELCADILTKETDFRDAIEFLSKQGVTIN